MRYRKAGYALAILLLGLSVAALLVPLPRHFRSPWHAKLFDLGHVPLFALVTVCFWWMVRPRLWLAFGLAAALAVATEIGQGFTGGSPELLGAVRGVLGALICVLVLH